METTAVRTRKLTGIALLCGVAYLATLLRVPVGGFLVYDPKDIIVALGGFLYGPLAALVIAVVSAFLEMLTISAQGPVGMLMSVVAAASFACPAAVIYKRGHNLKSAVLGLLAGMAAMVAMMMLWNYFITPLYTGAPREAVVAMMLPLLLPFNLVKAGLNAGITMLIYKPVVTALRKAHLVAPSEGEGAASTKMRAGAMILAGLVVATAVLGILVLGGWL